MVCKLCLIRSNMKSWRLILSSSGYDSSACLAYPHGIRYPPVSCLCSFLGYQAHCHHTSVLVFQWSLFCVSLASDSKSSVVKEVPGHSTWKGSWLWNCAAVLCNMWENKTWYYPELRNKPQFQTSTGVLERNPLDEGDPWTYKRNSILLCVYAKNCILILTWTGTWFFDLVSCCK